MAIDTKLNQLVINKLTKAQYQEAKEANSIVENEIYMVTDDTPIDFPVDSVNGKTGAVNLSAEDVGAVSKVNVITTKETDLNDYVEEGVYYFSSTYTPTNIPFGTNGWLEVKPSGSGSVKQFWYRMGTVNSNDYHIAVRTYAAASGWSDWVRLLTAKDCISLAQGGTGTTVDLENAPTNAIIKKLGGDYNQLYYTATKSGAFYATAANGAAQFGTLPVAQGGTGVTTDKAIGLKAYPVNSIYMSVNSTSPASLFGGTWTQLKDRFLLGAGSTYSNGATGGAATVTLTAEQIPSHAHALSLGGGTDEYGTTRSILTQHTRGTTGYTDTTAIHNRGNGQAHNNMPPYLVVYMWKRTA